MDNRPAPGAGMTSVVMPTFNRGHLVRESLQSVLSQTRGSLEVIVVDDGSTDDTQDVLASFDDSRVVVVRQPNGGKSAARNRGLSLSKGDYIAFLDDDDLWEPTFLETLVSVLESNAEVDFVFSDMIRFGDAGRAPGTQFDLVQGLRTLPWRPATGSEARIILGDPFLALVPFRAFVTWLPTVLLRARCVRRAVFPPTMPLGQDFSFMLQIYRDATVAAYLDRPLALARRHADNSYRTGTEHLIPTLKALLDIREGLDDPRRMAALDRRTGQQLLSIGYTYHRTASTGAALTAYARALRYPGSRLNAVLHLFTLPIAAVLGRLSALEEPSERPKRPPLNPD